MENKKALRHYSQGFENILNGTYGQGKGKKNFEN